MDEEEPNTEGQDEKRVLTGDEKVWVLVSHLGGLATSFIAPLVVWVAKKDDSEFIEDQSKEALNFQITMFIVFVLGSALTCIGVGIVVSIAAAILDLVLCLIATLRSYDGHRYRYPFSIRLVK